MFRATHVIILGLAIYFTLWSARAQSNEFLTSASQIIQSLQAKGYSNFSHLHLDTFLQQMSSVEIQFSNQLTAAKRNQNGRISARWEVYGSKKLIRVYTPSWNRFSEQRPMLALHEYLGVLGYDDDNYWLSTQLWTLSLQESSALSADERAAIEQSIASRVRPLRMQLAASGGGVVGVGGGGEGGTVWLRQRQIKQGLSGLNDASVERSRSANEVFNGLEGTSEAGYGNFWSKETKARIRKMQARRKSYCMINAGLCKVRIQSRGSDSCRCSGYDEEGMIVSTENPWKLLD